MKRRPPAHRSNSNTDTDSEEHRPSKRFRSTSTEVSGDGTEPTTGPIKIYIVQEKLDDKTIRELFDLVELAQKGRPPSVAPLNLEICKNAEGADLIITNIRMKKRFERHVLWNIAKQKAIVTPDWLRESIKKGRLVECGNHAAFTELHDKTVEHCPDESNQDTGATSRESSPSLPRYQPPAVKPTSLNVFKNWRSRYACQRASPLVCVNQALAEELAVLGEARELEGLRVNALAYERAVSLIKSYPYHITQEAYKRDLVKLPGLGSKTMSKIQEFISSGSISESRTTCESERYQSLSLFSKIYGIGPVNARKLYDIGCRGIEDLERYYDVAPGSTIESVEEDLVTPDRKKIPKNKIPDLPIKISLALREDFAIPIPREEVEEMHGVVMHELDLIQPGCVSTIVGGYRRGKPYSNDADIVISHSDIRNGANIIKGLCKRLTQRLHASGVITHVMHLSGFHAHNALRTEHWDSLEKALTVLVLPSKGKEKRLHRRLDLIFASPAAYWTAVVGWSGSKMFERDLRLWAKTEKGMKFDSSGMTRRHDSKLLIPRSEEEVFDCLGLEWVDPTMRNADV
ncbi:DNA polymerase mu [Gymnopilus junonius]|uniref:DNA polymerase mu n=1 Tax=Gymnopilus junonius TaxID=109634 RepID=A0A9P5TTL5_GYMJU|nr:DNA polymerase mu [Gymnopilus junonius]